MSSDSPKVASLNSTASPALLDFKAWTPSMLPQCQADGYLSWVLIFLACFGSSQLLPHFFSTNVQGEIHSRQINVTAIMKTTTQTHEGRGLWDPNENGSDYVESNLVVILTLQVNIKHLEILGLAFFFSSTDVWLSASLLLKTLWWLGTKITVEIKADALWTLVLTLQRSWCWWGQSRWWLRVALTGNPNIHNSQWLSIVPKAPHCVGPPPVSTAAILPFDLQGVFWIILCLNLPDPCLGGLSPVTGLPGTPSSSAFGGTHFLLLQCTAWFFYFL